MKFQIRSIKALHISENNEEEISILLKIYPCLYKYNLNILKNTAYIYIDSLNQLMELRKEIDNELIIDSDYIEIYDSYRE